MGASQSIQSYTLLPDDEVELIILNDTSEEVSFADKVETKVCSSFIDNYQEYISKRKKREEEKQKLIQKEIQIKKMLNELVEIARTSLINGRYEPIPQVEVDEVLTKYDNICYSKEMYNIIDVVPEWTPSPGWDGGRVRGWKVCIDKKTANECVMVVTKCIFTKAINTYELILKDGQGYLSKRDENGKYAYVPDWAMKHAVFLVTSAGISDLDIYEGFQSRDGRDSEQSWRRRRHMYRSHGGNRNGEMMGMIGGFGAIGGFGGGMGGGMGGGFH